MVYVKVLGYLKNNCIFRKRLYIYNRITKRIKKINMKNLLIYESIWNLVDVLNDAQIAELFKALNKFRKNELVQFDDLLLQGLWLGLLPNLNNLKDNYSNKIQQNKENGKKGGRPKKDTTSTNKEIITPQQIAKKDMESEYNELVPDENNEDYLTNDKAFTDMLDEDDTDDEIVDTQIKQNDFETFEIENIYIGETFNIDIKYQSIWNKWHDNYKDKLLRNNSQNEIIVELDKKYKSNIEMEHLMKNLPNKTI